MSDTVTPGQEPTDYDYFLSNYAEMRDGFKQDLDELIAQAVSAEREACAEIASDKFCRTDEEIARVIAREIRSRNPESVLQPPTIRHLRLHP